MNKQMYVGAAGIAVLVAAGWIEWAGHGSAGEAGGLKDSVLKIVAAIKKGNTASADAQAAAMAKKIEDLGDLMNFFKKREKGGLGVGSKSGVVVPDGIEIKLTGMSRDAPSVATLKKEADALEEMGYVIVAMAKVAKVNPIPAVKGKDWAGWCDDMAANGLKFSAAAKSRGAADLKSIAGKIKASCDHCHTKYR